MQFWDAFRLMHDHHVSAVPIVDEHGALVGALSARDLRHLILEPAKFPTLAKPIGQFFTKGASTHAYCATCSPRAGLDLFTAKETDTLEQVVRKFQAGRVHRLFVVDGSGKVTSVVSLRDVIAQFVREPESEDGVNFWTRISGQK